MHIFPNSHPDPFKPNWKCFFCTRSLKFCTQIRASTQS